MKTVNKNWRDRSGQAHEHINRNKIEIFRQTQPSFSFRRERMYVSTRQRWHHLCPVLTYICSLLIEKDGCVCWNILSSYVCSCACPPWSHQFLVRVFSFFSLILWYFQICERFCYFQKILIILIILNINNIKIMAWLYHSCTIIIKLFGQR